MTNADSNHPWSPKALILKAQLFDKKMNEFEHGDWEFGFWSALVVQLLGRAALSSISPTLLAEGKDWQNIYYALGFEAVEKKRVPRSRGIEEVFGILESHLDGFTQEMRNFASLHMKRRNEEVHTGAVPFLDLGTADWLPRYYELCGLFLDCVGQAPEEFFGTNEWATASELIESKNDEAAKSVKKLVAAHNVMWSEKGEGERETLAKQAAVKATGSLGHRVECPACKSAALVFGSPVGNVKTTIDEDEIVEKQSMFPKSFECSACGLKISGYAKLSACGLGDAFTETTWSEPSEYFGIEHEDPSDFEDYGGWNNE